jgi:adenosine kinase
MEALPYVDVLFGNETEAAALAATEGWEGLPLETVALKVKGKTGVCEA